MAEIKDIFLDKDLRCGGFFELAIQVCPSINNQPIKLYTNYVWSLENVEGPYDDNFNLVQIDIETFQHRGIIRLGEYKIPFMTYNVRETKPIETGFNWFDICFYTACIEHVFGGEYQTWTGNPKVPTELSDFFMCTIKQLYKIYPFKLAMLDYEVSGQYYLNDLQKPLNNNWTSSAFFVGQDNFKKIADENKKLVTIIEEI
jgi:hypothetical protein